MNAKDFELKLSRYVRTESDMDQRIRSLRETENVFPSARGRHSPDLNAREATLMLLTLAPCKSVDGGKVASRVNMLPVVPRDGIDVCGTFSDFLSGLINEQGGAYRAGVDRVEILEDGSAAHVYFKDGRKLLFSADSIHWNQPSNSYDFMGESRPERRLRVSFGFIDQIEIWLNSPEIGALLSDCAP